MEVFLVLGMKEFIWEKNKNLFLHISTENGVFYDDKIPTQMKMKCNFAISRVWNYG